MIIFMIDFIRNNITEITTIIMNYMYRIDY